MKANRSFTHNFFAPLFIICVIFSLLSLDSCKRSRSSGERTSARDSTRRESSKRDSSSTNKAGSLSEKKRQALRTVYENTINHWQYDEAAYSYNYTPQQRLDSGRGICWDYALYFYNECKKKGLHDVHFVVSNKIKHAWNEVWEGNNVYIIDATMADTDQYEGIDKYFLIDATIAAYHHQIDISVVDDTMVENDISSLYRGVFVQDSKRQKYTAARPIVKLKPGY